MVDAEIAEYYGHGLEQDRLAAGRGRIEFIRMRELLGRSLPAAPATVLDVGGGAGAYALPLAADGYQVHLVDPMPLHVEQALAASQVAASPLASASLGDARSLAAADRSADAVLLLGPLYHLTSRADRVTALREAARVLRPGGVVVAKGLSRFYLVFEGLADGSPAEPGWRESLPRFLADGQYRNPGGDPAAFTTSFFHRPEGLTAEVADAGLRVRELIAVSGHVKLLPGLSERLDDPAEREHLLTLLRLVESEPSMIGASQNFIAIAGLPAAALPERGPERMTSPGELRFRAATADDAPAVAALHADSWRRHYRGAFSDSFLDGDVGGYLLDRWAGRLAAPGPQARTIVAEAGGELVGLSHIVLGEHPDYGALLDNLHVAYGRKRLGIGTRLMAETGRTVLECAPGSGLHLWVLEQNTAARAFYTARGGVWVETAAPHPPGGDPSRLNGRPKALRFVWPNPSTLL